MGSGGEPRKQTQLEKKQPENPGGGRKRGLRGQIWLSSSVETAEQERRIKGIGPTSCSPDVGIIRHQSRKESINKRGKEGDEWMLIPRKKQAQGDSLLGWGGPEAGRKRDQQKTEEA